LSSTHLTEIAASQLSLSAADRIRIIREERWLPYTAANDIISDIKDLMAYPKRGRMPCRLLIADSNNGKTSLLRRIRELNPPDENLSGDHANIPVVSAILNGPDEKLLYRKLLEGLFVNPPPKSSPGDLEQQLVQLLKRIQPRIILLDEANTLVTGSATKVRTCLNAIKNLTNSTQISIVAAGTKEARFGFKSDPQIENRFEPRELPIWKEGVEYRRLLLSFEKITPLAQPSNLSGSDAGLDILNKTGGLIGEISSLISAAATYAINKGIEKITPEVIASCAYRPDRRRREVT
jgi:hypothetical protein